MMKSNLTMEIEFLKIELGQIILPPKEFLRIILKMILI